MWRDGNVSGVGYTGAMGGHMHDDVELMGMPFAHVDAAETLTLIFDALVRGQGGLLLTANLDILRRYVRDANARVLYGEATLVVADGMPIVWASRIRGTPLPARVAGASLVPAIAARAATQGRTIYLLGGEGEDARDAKHALERLCPGVRIVGVSSPRVSPTPTREEVAVIAATLVPLAPDIVLVAMGSPKQEALASALREALPRAWFVGVGASLAFLAGRVSRAPELMQRLGLEWVHRLGTEPTRLARRYLIEGLPFAAELMLHAARARMRR